MPIVKRTSRTWTPEMDAELMSYYEHGLRPSYMAEQMGLTIASVEGRYRNLKRKAALADNKKPPAE
jgi:hypothetical protein